jgi:hypothetical protein
MVPLSPDRAPYTQCRDQKISLDGYGAHEVHFQVIGSYQSIRQFALL